MQYSLNDYKNSTMTMCKYKGWDQCSVERVWLLLTEEIGELAGSIRRHNNLYKDRKKIKIEDELGDVFSYLFQLAGILDIDLNKMWETNQNKSIHKKYFKEYNTNYKNECRGSKYTRFSSNRAENRQMVYNT